MIADPALSFASSPRRSMSPSLELGVPNDHGSYVTAYPKQPDGSWKALAEIATSEMLPSSATASAK